MINKQNDEPQITTGLDAGERFDRLFRAVLERNDGDEAAAVKDIDSLLTDDPSLRREFYERLLRNVRQDH